MKRVFRTTNLNNTGVCLSLACEWIKAARAGHPIYDESGFRSRLATFLNHHVRSTDTSTPNGVAPNGIIDSIKNIYHLPIRDSMTQWEGLDLNALDSWVDDTFFLGFMVISLMSPVNDGHSVAIWYGPTRFMYFDPNIGCFEFNNAIEMFGWIKHDLEGPIRRYPLINRRVNIVMIPK